MSLVPSIRPRTTAPRRSSGTRVHQIYPFQSPMKGLDVARPLPGSDPLTALRLENLIPRAFGVTLRRGYERWCSNMAGEIHTLMEYQPQDPLLFKMFAASSDGNVYDITSPLASGVTPPIDLTPGATSVDGFSWLNFTTGAGVHYLIFVAAGVGMWVYDGAAWTNITMGAGPMQIAGVNPSLFSHVMVFKNRLWFIETGSTRGWYLPFNVIAGAATAFDFGAFMPHGGYLAGLTNWTVDSGEGIDDKFVAIGSQGDVLVYTGVNPAVAAEFSMDGRWYIGRVPVGHRFFTQYATDVAILSEKGMCFLSELLRGQGFFGNAATANNINLPLSDLVTRLINQRHWEVVFLPAEQLIIINVPLLPSGKFVYAFEVNQRAFCTLTAMPMYTIDQLNGRSFFGDIEGNVWLAFEGNSDGAVDDVAGTDLEGKLLSAFMTMGEAVRIKRWLMIRPSFIARSRPAFNVKLNSDWNFNMPAGAPPFVFSDSSLWDFGLWDSAIWSGESNSYESWVGAEGTGRYAALSMRVRGESDTVFVGWHALVSVGGIL